MTEKCSIPPQPKLALYLKCPSLPGMTDTEIPSMNEPSSTIFNHVQQLLVNLPGNSKSGQLKRLWEPTYIILHQEATTDLASISAEKIYSNWLSSSTAALSGSPKRRRLLTDTDSYTSESCVL